MKNMRPGQREPNELECAILEQIAREEPWVSGPFGSLRVLSREYTGVGCFTKFACDESGGDSDPYPGLRAVISVPGIPNGMGAVLFCKGRFPACLELFTYDDDYWDGTYEGFSLAEAAG